jgi:hypothetical protein
VRNLHPTDEPTCESLDRGRKISQTGWRRTHVSIVRVGLTETKGYGDGYDAIFKKGAKARKAAAPATPVAPAAPARKVAPVAKKVAPVAKKAAPVAKKAAPVARKAVPAARKPAKPVAAKKK